MASAFLPILCDALAEAGLSFKKYILLEKAQKVFSLYPNEKTFFW